MAEKFLAGTDVPQIKEDDRENLGMDMTEEEITKALSTMKNHSAPAGIDGITTSFLKFFWNKIKDRVIDSLKAARAVGQMSPPQRKAVITLIHKGKDLQHDDLNHWCPISSTNTDYKILAKGLFRRVSNVIEDIMKTR